VILSTINLDVKPDRNICEVEFRTEFRSLNDEVVHERETAVLCHLDEQVLGIAICDAACKPRHKDPAQDRATSSLS
jgi:hypothetical protein